MTMACGSAATRRRRIEGAPAVSSSPPPMPTARSVAVARPAAARQRAAVFSDALCGIIGWALSTGNTRIPTPGSFARSIGGAYRLAHSLLLAQRGGIVPARQNPSGIRRNRLDRAVHQLLPRPDDECL